MSCFVGAQDGVMFMHSPRLPELENELKQGTIGPLKRVVGDFSFCGDESFLVHSICCMCMQVDMVTGTFLQTHARACACLLAFSLGTSA